MIGELRPESWYTIDGLDLLGIGPVVRQQFRKAGFKPVKVGKVLWFRGRDLVAWFESMQ